MKNKLFFGMIAGTVLAIGALLAGCDMITGSNGGEPPSATTPASGGAAAYTVSFDPGEGSGTPPPNQTVNAGTGITLPGQGSMTAPDGKIFSGWTTANGLFYAAAASYTVNANTAFTAQWVIQAANPPDTPAGVQAEAGSSGSISVSWNAVTGADSYKVFYGTSASSIDSPAGAVTGTSYTHSGLEANTTYYYRIKAVNSAGESGESSPVSATTQASGGNGGTTTPGVPTGVTATAYSDTSVFVTWNAEPNAVSYRVYYENPNASSPAKTLSTGGGWEGETGYYVENLTLSTTYNFYVTSLYWDSAANRQAESDYSSPASAATMSEPPPLPGDPSDVQATADSADTVTVTWSPGANAARYEVSWRISDDANDNRTTKTTTDTSITITGLESHTSYYFEVIAVNAAGRSPGHFGVGASCTTGTKALVIRAVVESPSSILVSWDEAAWVATYTLSYRKDSGSSTNINVEGTSSSYRHTGLSAGTYYYQIEAFDNDGQVVERSVTVSATIMLPPADLTTAAGTGISIRLSWTAVTGATGYKVEYREGSSGEWTPIQEAITSASYTHSGLTEGITYYYRVKAVNSGGESGYSDTASRTALSVPPAPTGVTAVAQSSSSIRVSWNAVSGATSYKVYYTTASSTTNLADTVTGMPYTHTGLQAGTTYVYYIAAVNSAGTQSVDYLYATANATTSSSGGGSDITYS
jgi:fibronectin type 3 domain-containing protein